MNLSICIITKDEEANIETCLRPISNLGAEIVVVDTGSADMTKSIAMKYTDKVYDYVWQDDFGAAKSYAISKASNDNILILDSDETILENGAEGIKELLEKLAESIECNNEKVGRIKRINILDENEVPRKEYTEWINRAFNRKLFLIKGRIHEQVVAKNSSNYDTFLTDIIIEHNGYSMDLEQKKLKAERNFRLLKLRLEELILQEPESEEIPYNLYQCGKSCYMSQEFDLACEYFSKGLEYDLNPKLEYVIDMVETYGYALINSGRISESLSFTEIYDVFGDSADFKFLMGIIYMQNAKFEEAVSEFIKATQYKNCKMAGVNSYLAYYNVGVIYECLGKIDMAVEYYKKCGEYKNARKRLKN